MAAITRARSSPPAASSAAPNPSQNSCSIPCQASPPPATRSRSASSPAVKPYSTQRAKNASTKAVATRPRSSGTKRRPVSAT